MGTAFLLTPEARTPPLHRAALKQADDASTTLTNLFTGRPARAIVNRYVRELGPISSDTPQFPLAAAASHPLRAASEARGSIDFMPLWSGQTPALARELAADELVGVLARETEAALSRVTDDGVEQLIDEAAGDRRVAHQQAVEQRTEDQVEGQLDVGPEGSPARPCSARAGCGWRRDCAR